MMERDYWLGFSVFSGIGPMKFKTLLSRFGSAKDAWGAPVSGLEKIIGEKLAAKFDDFKNKFSIENYVGQLKKKDVSFVVLEDKEYPELLKKIKNPPFVLYVRGVFHFNDSNHQSTIAIVGTRRTTQYGREVTKILTEELVASGFTIVSGLAIGVDAISHKAAIENNGKTIAVLGCGVDCCNPGENQSLYNSILRSGNCIISEYPLQMPPTQWTFPTRNRIIAGLSQAVLVTEGAEDSGSLITAEFALKFGRKVFAVPGPITSTMSKGPYKLIAKGAKLVTSGEDIFKDLRFKINDLRIRKTERKGDTEEENVILKLLENEALHFDEIVRRAKFSSSKLGSILSLMEIKGLIKSLDGGMFSI